MTDRLMVASKRTMVIALAVVGFAVCSVVFYVHREITSPSGADTAVWEMNPFEPPPRDGSTFRALVSRLGCNDGVNGRVLAPTIERTADTVTVTFTVEKASPGAHTCPGPLPTPYDVDLGEPIGNRSLVDGACLSGAAATSSCSENHGVVLAANDHFPYVLMFQDCATPGSASRLAVELHLDTVAPPAVAEAVAQKFATALQQYAKQGCLDALEGRVQRYQR